MLEVIYWISMFIVLYVYIGYPIVVLLLGGILDKPIIKKTSFPIVTVVIAAFNEEENIVATVQNKLEQDYPEDKLEILVVSDGSDDGTDQLVSTFTDSRVRLIRQESRAGKTSALNLAVGEARGDIIVFSDANSIYAPGALSQLVGPFSDPDVGYVTGRMIYAHSDGSAIGNGCSAYMKYENFLRSAENKIGSIVGVDGGVDAVRAKLYQPMNSDQLPDFVLPLKVVAQGYRVVYEPGAILWESALDNSADEYRMRVRVSLRAFWALFDMRQLLSPTVNPLYAWQLWSHKVLRYLCFLFLFLFYISNWGLWSENALYQASLIVQQIFYMAAICLPWLEKKGFSSKVLSFIRYFILLNIAAAHAFAKFLVGGKQVIWTPRKG